jgi:hypothetical protein
MNPSFFNTKMVTAPSQLGADDANPLLSSLQDTVVKDGGNIEFMLDSALRNKKAGRPV